jgi:NTP pyrophosphatase (non-canonical NTP hydrolase)
LDRKEIFRAIEVERERQDQLHPKKKIRQTGDKETDLLQNLLLHYEFMPILVEEVGEVGTALQGEGDLQEELIHVASVCVKWLENFNN